MAYGDALGFSNENEKEKSLVLKKFMYQYQPNLTMEKQKGQYSFVTELVLIIIKCFVDNAAEMKVTVDYTRLYEELKLWEYYRHGHPPAILRRLQVKNYYKSSYYWEDKNHYGISRIIPILLANKNYRVAEIEAYKNIIYFNRHPRIILLGLLLLRTGYIILENQLIDKEELIQQLKSYLINLQLQELNDNMKSDLPKNYNILFEKEKIQYLMNLDRYKNKKEGGKEIESDYILSSIEIYYCLKEKGILALNNHLYHYGKEEIAIALGFWGMSGKEYELEKESLKDQTFIYDMGRFLYRLRNYEGNRKIYTHHDKRMDLFQLEKDNVIKHPILNVIKIKEKEDVSEFTKLLIQTKSCLYTFIKPKTRK